MSDRGRSASGWTTIDDAQSVILSNGTYMQANCCTKDEALFNATTLTWTPTGAGKFDISDEEGWTLLPSGKVLTVDAYVPVQRHRHELRDLHALNRNLDQRWQHHSAAMGFVRRIFSRII
jgi:hypothetical protein